MAAAAGLEPASFPVNSRASSPGRLSRTATGTAGRSRTCGLCDRNAVLCSSELRRCGIAMVGATGLEPATELSLARLKVGCLQPIWTTPQLEDAWVWVVGFQPTTSWFQARNADQTALHPAEAPSKSKWRPRSRIERSQRVLETHSPALEHSRPKQQAFLAGAVGFEPTVQIPRSERGAFVHSATPQHDLSRASENWWQGRLDSNQRVLAQSGSKPDTIGRSVTPRSICGAAYGS